MAGRSAVAGPPATERIHRPLAGLPHFAPKAKAVIYLHMNGAPSQMDLWDYKPQMAEYFDKDLPDSVRMGQRITTMTSGQARFPIAPSKYKFAQHGKYRQTVPLSGDARIKRPHRTAPGITGHPSYAHT
jgi:hypothetical protein